MILTILLLFILLILAIVTITVVGTIGAGAIIIFGDVIVCALVIIWIIKKLVNRNKE